MRVEQVCFACAALAGYLCDQCHLGEASRAWNRNCWEHEVGPFFLHEDAWRPAGGLLSTRCMGAGFSCCHSMAL